MVRTAHGAAAVIAAGIVVALALTLAPDGSDAGGDDATEAAAATSKVSAGSGSGKKEQGGTDEEAWDGTVEVIGDGSTSYTGPQPDQPKIEKLKPGEKPPQFVVFSWDGALQGDDRLFSHFREVAKENNAHMTFFLTSMYLLPNSKAELYTAPLHDPGEAAISFATDEHIRSTLEQLRRAWLDGNEIGTHFNGHYCGADGGGDWTTAQWKSEIQQSYEFVEQWKTNTGFTDIDPLPFDFRKELAGGRAPCLEGQENLVKAAKSLGWTYDSSSPGDFQIWPSKTNGIWNFPLQLLPYPGEDFQVLSMDFNFLYNQSGDSTEGDPAMYPVWEEETREGYMNGFDRVYNGSRAPLIIGNHFEQWNGGIYMRAVEEVMTDVCNRDDVRCVSFKQLAEWMDAQDPDVLDKLRLLDPAQSPDWKTYIKK